jgi:hypothetical protein
MVIVCSSLACLDCSDLDRFAGLLSPSSMSTIAGSGVLAPARTVRLAPPLIVGFVLGLAIVTLIFFGFAAPPGES